MTNKQKQIKKALEDGEKSIRECSVLVKKDGKIEIVERNKYSYENYEEAWSNYLKYANYPIKSNPEVKDKIATIRYEK